MRNPFKRKAYHNPSIYVTARELSEWLATLPDDTMIKTPTGGFITSMNYHELTGVFLA